MCSGAYPARVSDARVSLRRGRGSRLAASAAAAICLFVLLPATASAAPTGQWEHSYDGPGHGNDAYVAVATDAEGNAYAAGTAANVAPGGQNALLVSYAADGTQRWTRLFGAPAGGAESAADVVCDSTNHIWVAGSTGGSRSDVLVIRYSSSGARLWTRTLDFKGKADRAVAMATDGHGAGYVAADCAGTKSRRLIVYKLSGTGRVLWRKLVGPATASTQPADIAVTSGMVVVCGWERPAGGSRVGLLAALSPTGSTRWTSYGITTSASASTALRLSCSGTGIWVVGKLLETAGSQRSYVSDYSPNGTRVGTYETAAGSAPEDLSAVAAQTDGSAWAAGTQQTTSGSTVAIFHLTPAGTVAQSYVFPRTASAVWGDSCAALCSDDAGSVWAAGSQGSKAYLTGFMVRADSTLGWWGLSTVPAASATVPAVETVAAAEWTTGALYVAGSSRGTGGHSDALLIRFSPLH